MAFTMKCFWKFPVDFLQHNKNKSRIRQSKVILSAILFGTERHMKRKHFAWWKNFPSWSSYLRVNGFPDRSSRERHAWILFDAFFECNSFSSLFLLHLLAVSVWSIFVSLSMQGWMDYFDGRKKSTIREVAWRHWIIQPLGIFTVNMCILYIDKSSN